MAAGSRCVCPRLAIRERRGEAPRAEGAIPRVRRRDTSFWAVAAALVGAAALAYALLLGRAPATPATRGTAADAARLELAAASGDVTVVRADGTRVAAAAGLELRADDAVVAGPGARAELAAGASYRVVLEESGRVEVKEITAELSRFRLEGGLVSATVRDDPARAFEIESARDAVARTHGGELAVARGSGDVAVGVTRGEAEFRSGGSSVVIRAGEQSRAREGAAPTAPAPIPPSLLLKVSWPEERLTNRRRIVVTGRTHPGALVAVGGERVDVAPDGRFTKVVYLREGRQDVAVTARDVGGHRAEARSAPIVLDTRAPDAQFDTRDLWRRSR